MTPPTEGTKGIRNPIHNPFPASLSSECKKAGGIIDSIVNPTFAHLTRDGEIPSKFIRNAKALIICTAVKLGMLGSVRFGSGLMVARLPDGTWSGPSAIALGGIGVGGQFGLEITNFVFVLNSDAAVATFCKSGVLTLDGNISITLGPGRSAEYGALVGTSGVACLYAYSKTRGVYGGATLEVSILSERPRANKKMYGRKLKAMQLLGGDIPPPPEAEPLMRILNSEALRMPSLSDGPGSAELALPDQHEAQSREVSELAAGERPVVEVAGALAVGADENRSPHEVEASSGVTELVPTEEPVVEAEAVSAVEVDESHSSQDVEAPSEVVELSAEEPQDESQTSERSQQQGQSSG